MRKLPPQEEKIKRAIRDVISFDPLISVDRLRNALFDRGFKTFDNNPLKWEYIAKLRDKIHRQTIEEVDRKKLIERITEFKEKNRLVFDRLVRIAFYTDDLKKEGISPPSFKDQISALNSIVKLDLAIFGAELDAGIFKRHIGKIEIEKRFIPLPDDQRMAIMEALQNYGFISEQKIINAEYATKPTTVIDGGASTK